MTYPTADGSPVRLVLAFLAEAPPDDPEWTRHTAAGLAAASGSTPLWGGAFLPVVPGSLAHLDSLR